MNILAVDGSKIKACAQFGYKGYMVSFSTTFKGTSVMVFKDSFETSCNSVEDAISIIDKLTAEG